MNKKLTIIIDMVNGFAKEGNLFSQNIKNIIPTVVEVAKASNNIILFQDAHDQNDIEFSIYPSHCIKGSKESRIIDELLPFVTKNNLFAKNTTNAFWDIDSNLLLNYDSIEIVGCCTDICVLQFVLTLKTFLTKHKQLTKLIVYENAVATFDAENHNADQYHNNALNLMKNAGIEILKW
ncbi:nicotinamidase [Mycoplasma sp. NEAQ87857]|uniref:cysteine hydrolase family protein n=1 Tax=Mycoplasma sp. NEAQ87857 TaxID=2683967 RepID=UPI001315AF82|nr:isochorismatase family cysteine hydrolase [Mycoplasma sp. NEAQ87857]QGZ97287.1 nicotinamidase [Mycoplasma sp. NEAQ87857]